AGDALRHHPRLSIDEHAHAKRTSVGYPEHLTAKLRRVNSFRSASPAGACARGPLLWRGLKPLPGAAHAVSEGDPGPIIELRLDARDRGLGVADIAAARGHMIAGQRAPEQVLELGDDVEQRMALVARDVEHRAGNSRRGEGETIGVHDVVDVGEVARL